MAFRHVALLLLLLFVFAPQFVHAAAGSPEYRMLWVDIFHAGFRTAGEIDAMLDTARLGNYNAVVVEARKACDAFYNSKIEPKNQAIASGFDPLRYLIDRAHAPGAQRIEVHAWLVTYRARMPNDDTWRNPRHVFQRHPEWLSQKSDGKKEGSGDQTGRYYLDPGVPQVIDYTLEVVRDLLTNYDVDGIMFDYIRYPEPEGGANKWGYNPIAIERFNRLYGRSGKPDPGDPQFAEFRRAQVTHLVRKIYAHLRAWRPKVKVGAATIAWGSIDRGFERSDAYTTIFQDWPRIAQLGYVDIISPMNYKRERIAAQAADHRKWARFIGALGQNSGRFAVNMVDGETLNDLSGIVAQVSATRDMPGIAGIGSYSYAETRRERTKVPDIEFFQTMRSKFFSSPAPVPEATWLTRPAHGLIKGIVTQDRRPADGARVTVGSQSTQCDGTGFYAFTRVAPGTHTVQVDTGSGKGSIEVTVRAGQVAEAPVAVK